LPYQPQAELASDEVINHWQLGAFLCPHETIQKDYNPQSSRFRLIQTQQTDQTGAGSVFESYGRFQKMAEGEAAARYRLEQMRNTSKQGEAQSNCIRLRPGKVFDLEEHPHPPMNSRWVLVTINHHGRQPAADSSRNHEQGTALANHFTFIPNSHEWRPPYHYKPLADGEELATVVGPEGEEIYVNQQGAVKVHFHWDRYGKADDNASCWVRVAQGWNGGGFGLFATPRVGQEVIVAYLNGDIDRPIITGTTYNGFNPPPLYLPEEKTRTILRTQTYKGEGFNELRFDDAKGEEEIYIHAQKNIDIEVLNSKNERIDYDRTTQIGHDESLVVAHDRKITVEGKQDHKTTGNYLEWVAGDKNLTISGDFAKQIDGILSARVDGDITLQSDRKVTLRVGGSMLVLHAGGVDIKGPNVNLNTGISPGDVLSPTRPDILAAAAKSGSMFVAHCPPKKRDDQ
jgi:type VI secretion system secreted protein VgrG